MKKLATILMIALGIGFMLSSCGGSKTTPEEEVRNYGNYFIEKVKTNQIDSLKASYPAIADADSITPIVADSVIVTPSATPGEFDLALGEDVKLKVRRSEDGKIDVVESRGLFAYPP